MKKFFLYLFLLLSPLMTFASASLDSEGFPIVYLRGNFNATNWTPKETYRFSRSGNVYTLVISQANAIGDCSFKIGDDDWDLCDIGGDVTVNTSQLVDGIRRGPNMKTGGLSDCIISFAYAPNASNTTIKFMIDGMDPGDTPPVKGLSGTLPVLYINVYADENHTILNNEILSKDLTHKNYFTYADYWLDLNGCQWLEDLGAESIGSPEEPLPLQIKARGNWTLIGFAKKPFKLKLDKKQTLLGLSKSKHFAILAHADDNKGFLRNFVGFNLGQRIGLPWTPSQQPVEVVINGDYRGLYFLTESIRIEEERINITELPDNADDPKLLSGGYLVELDNYDEDETSQIRMEEEHIPGLRHNYDMLRITFDTPEVYSDLQRQFITEQFSTMNHYVGTNDDRLWSYLDLDDAARYYLVEEIVSHTESYHGSTYLFRDFGDGRKWHFSPLWDFGNAFNGSTSDFFYNCDPYGNTWIPSMRENKKFNDKVKETWLWFMSNEFDGLEADIDLYASHILEAAKADYARWGSGVADNRNLQSRSREVKEHIASKTAWLKGRFGDYSNGYFPEPDRDTTPAAELPSYVATGITDISDDDPDVQAIYYTLQGIRVDHPQRGTIYIVKRGSKTAKVIF